MIIAFGIWSIVSLIFVLIGIISWRSDKTVGFFTGVEPPKVSDIKVFNHAVAKIWFVFAVALEFAGIPLLCEKQNSPIVLLMVITVPALIIVMIIVYLKVEMKYRE